MTRAYARMRRQLAGVLVVAVTGTKGKTSTSEFIAQLMEARGLVTAVSTTESARIGPRSMEACENGQEVYCFVDRCQRAGVQCLVIELCSSALEWNLHHAFDIDVAVLTNIGTDHIRYHGNRRNYLSVKKRMFRDLKITAGSPHPVAILNADDENAAEFQACLPHGVTSCFYGTRPAPSGVPLHVSARDITYEFAGTSFAIHGLTSRPLPCRTSLHGAFNVSNVLAAVAGTVALGGRPREIVAHAPALAPPAGRFDIIGPPAADCPAVVVDFAHTPESLESALAGARDLLAGGRVHAVFGCGGDAYKRKRPLMGAVAAAGANTIVLTSDNPRLEDPLAIAKAILRGVPRTQRSRVRVELDRNRAIHSAVAAARPGDVVLILGKGTERIQEIGDRILPFSDARAAELAIEARMRAGAADDPFPLNARAAVLLDAGGEVLLARNSDAVRAPASLVKLMTLYLAFEDIARGRACANDTVTLSHYAALTPHPGLPCRAGDRIRLSVLLGAIAIRSANVAATAVAEHIGGDEAAFVARMNQKAHDLGLGSTRFATPHGLPHRHQKSTASDLAHLTRHLLRDHPSSRSMLRRRTFVYRGRSYARQISLFRHPGGIEALKTGFTDDAGYNLSVAARRRGRELFAVVLGATSRGASVVDAGRLLQYGDF